LLTAYLNALADMFDAGIRGSGMSHLPAIVQALAVVLLGAIALLFVRWSMAMVDSPLTLHACGRCTYEACGYCQRAKRDRVVSEYVRQARERKAARNG